MNDQTAAALTSCGIRNFRQSRSPDDRASNTWLRVTHAQAHNFKLSLARINSAVCRSLGSSGNDKIASPRERSALFCLHFFLLHPRLSALIPKCLSRLLARVCARASISCEPKRNVCIFTTHKSQTALGAFGPTLAHTNGATRQ